MQDSLVVVREGEKILKNGEDCHLVAEVYLRYSWANDRLGNIEYFSENTNFPFNYSPGGGGGVVPCRDFIFPISTILLQYFFIIIVSRTIILILSIPSAGTTWQSGALATDTELDDGDNTQ